MIRNLRFSSDGEWVVQIPILDNSPVELTEYFSVNLATTNPFVVFNNNMSTVEIRDDDGMSFLYFSSSLFLSSECVMILWLHATRASHKGHSKSRVKSYLSRKPNVHFLLYPFKERTTSLKRTKFLVPT